MSDWMAAACDAKEWSEPARFVLDRLKPMLGQHCPEGQSEYVSTPAVHPSRMDDARSPAQAMLKTHVHMVIRTPPRIDLPRLVQFFKGGSSFAASRQPGNVLGLRWAAEYSSTSVGPRQLGVVREYLRN